MKHIRQIVMLTIILLGVICAGASLGNNSSSPWKIAEFLLGYGDETQQLILVSFRLPRLILAAIVGCSLAVSGVLMQSALRNDLAEPGIMGAASGGNLGITLAIILNGFHLASPWTLPLISILCSMTTVLLVCVLACDRHILSPPRLLLTGVAVSTAISATTLVISLNIDRQAYTQALAWTAGSFNKADSNYVLGLSLWLAVTFPLTWFLAPLMDLLRLPDETGIGLGVSVHSWRMFLLLLGVAIGAAGMSTVGSVAFVGLVAPHIGRRLVGPGHTILLPAAALIGSSVVVFADTLGRTLFMPLEIPAGVIASTLGGIYFLYLLMTTRS